MIISDLELASIELPASDGGLRTLLVRITTHTGSEGWGETRLHLRPVELASQTKTLLANLSGRAVHDVESILALDVLTNRALACGVEMALWDLIARHARLPLCQLLGGVYRPSVPLAVRLPPGDAESVAHRARAMAAQGIVTQTLETTGQVADDVQCVAAAVDACARRVQFRLDAAQRYDISQARQLCRQLPRTNVEWVLDPVAGDQQDRLGDWQGLAPVAAGRSIRSVQDIWQAAAGGTLSAVRIDPVRVGGLLRARACAAVAEAAGLTACLTIENSSGLAVAASLQLAAATPSLAGALECAYPKLHDDLLLDNLRTADGLLSVPLAPGLGVEVNREKVEWYAAQG